MSRDALLQLGIVSVCLHTSQTENSATGASASPNARRIRAFARRAAPPRYVPTGCQAHWIAEFLPRRAHLHGTFRQPSLFYDQRLS